MSLFLCVELSVRLDPGAALTTLSSLGAIMNLTHQFSRSQLPPAPSSFGLILY